MGETWFQRLHGIGVSDYYGSYMSIMHDFRWVSYIFLRFIGRVHRCVELDWNGYILHAIIQSIISLM